MPRRVAVAATLPPALPPPPFSPTPSLSHPPSLTGYSKVGRRVRSRRRVDRAYGAKNAGGGKVPRERALVPTGSVLRPWRRDVPDSA